MSWRTSNTYLILKKTLIHNEFINQTKGKYFIMSSLNTSTRMQSIYGHIIHENTPTFIHSYKQYNRVQFDQIVDSFFFLLKTVDECCMEFLEVLERFFRQTYMWCFNNFTRYFCIICAWWKKYKLFRIIDPCIPIMHVSLFFIIYF